MKVGIDTFGLNGGKSGAGLYVRSLVSHLQNDADFQFELFGSEADKYTFNAGTNIPFAEVKIPASANAEKAWHFFSHDKFIKTQKYDCVMYPLASNGMLNHLAKKSLVIQNSVASKDLQSDEKSFVERFRIVHLLKKATCVVCPSMYVKKDLRALGIKEKRLAVIHNGIDGKLFFPRNYSETEDVIIKPFAIKRPYFIYGSRLSGLEKKHLELIKAFEIFKTKTTAPHRLVIAGEDDEMSESVFFAARSSTFSSDIFMTGFFPHESFPLLYAASNACVFPSVNEGVGIPILEAMASGVPVLCAKKAALPEMGGDAALYFDSENVNDIADAMIKIVFDDELRKSLIARGIKWVKRFDWTETASRIKVELAKMNS